MIPLFLPEGLSFSGRYLLGEALLPGYMLREGRLAPSQEGGVSGMLYQMSEEDWLRSDQQFSGRRTPVEVLFWGERAPGETYL